MLYFLAAIPILSVLLFMILFRWGGHLAGSAGWAIGLIIALIGFGLNFEVFWVSQVKSLFLSLFVLAILWPALFLYHIVNQTDGINAIANWLSSLIGNKSLLLLILAWAFSGLMEWIAGFGLPVAVVSPMLVGLGIAPTAAVAAVAIGHAWSVTFGDLGVVYETLLGLVQIDEAILAAPTTIMMGIACLLCGLAVINVLKIRKFWPHVLIIAGLMSSTLYLFVVTFDLIPLSMLAAGLSGILGGILLGKIKTKSIKKNDEKRVLFDKKDPKSLKGLKCALFSYGILALLLSAINLIPALNQALMNIVWQMDFPEVITTLGNITPAGKGAAIKPLLHPGTSMTLIAILSYLVFSSRGETARGDFISALKKTWNSAAPASLGVISMVGLATIMEHCGMTFLLAKGLSDLMGSVFPAVSPLVGILGAFATGSNNNSNVLFAPLQYNAAILLGLNPGFLLASQTTGGALGSMIAPAKIIVGCSTTGLTGRDGDVLKITLPYGLAIGLIIGLLTLVFC
ncbi:MAG: L-lactate permease [Anaerolineaceae bacterium]|nr:L-lactate permease [Anaerolineaceae bacterium]